MVRIELSEEEIELLHAYAKESPIGLLRQKSYAVLLRSRNISFTDITFTLHVGYRTVERWIKDFSLRRMASIFSGMVHNEHAGKLTREQKEKIKQEIGQPPDEYGIPKQFWDVPKLKQYVSAEFGVEYESDQSYHYLLKFSGLRFKYPDRRNTREDEAATKKRTEEIREELVPLLNDEDWVVLASDETRVQLEAEIRRAWIIKGRRTIVKTERSKEHQNYLGFLDQKTGVCQVFEIARGNQRESIRVLKLLMKQYPNKKVCVVWDNATCHKGKLLREELKKNKKLERLHLINFPPYAPMHNPIEHVWNYGKEKIKNRSNQAFEEIKQSFLSALANRTFDYTI